MANQRLVPGLFPAFVNETAFKQRLTTAGYLNETSGFVVYAYAGSGGLLTAGAATVAKGKAVLAAGGLTSSGASAATKTKAYTPSGGLTLSGDALTTKTKAVLALGGATFAGAASLAITKAFTASGGATFGGEALTGQVDLQTYTPSGGLLTAGTAGIAFGKVYGPDGGLSLAGAASLALTWAPLASSGAILGGSAATSFAESGTTQTWEYLPTGGISLAGGGASQLSPAATTPLVYSTVPGPYRRQPLPPIQPTTFRYVGTGGLRSGGSAPTGSINVAVWEPRSNLALTINGSAETAMLSAPAEMLEPVHTRAEAPNWIAYDNDFLLAA